MNKIPHRSVPDRDAKYMGLAWMMAGFSKDPNTQVGAIIVNPSTNMSLGWGYNGPPSEINDSSFSWCRPEKYDYILHAEDNAIDHSIQSLEGTHLYVTHMPCKRCMLRIVNKCIDKVIYMNCVKDQNSSLLSSPEIEKTLDIAKKGGVTLVEYKENLGWLADWNLTLRDIGVFDLH